MGRQFWLSIGAQRARRAIELPYEKASIITKNDVNANKRITTWKRSDEDPLLWFTGNVCVLDKHSVAAGRRNNSPNKHPYNGVSNATAIAGPMCDGSSKFRSILTKPIRQPVVPPARARLARE